MILNKIPRLGALLLCAVLGRAAPGTPASTDPALFGVFLGSTPCSEAIRPLLDIPAGAEADLIEWKLVLRQQPGSTAPAGYEMLCEYGPAVPNIPGLGHKRTRVTRKGSWTISRGTKGNPDAVVYELNGAVALCRIAPDVLHVLNRDRGLMVGNSGWSYTLNRARPPGPPPDISSGGGGPREISPLSTGPQVLGVFEGRTPGEEIARVLRDRVDRVSWKIKWRVTLYRDPQTGAPTTYKVESGFYPNGRREGRWSIVRGTAADSKATVYRLEPTETERALLLLKGDDNVLFFLDREGRPLSGDAHFSFTLNRRS